MADSLRNANRGFAKTHPGERAARQPVHVVYGGAQLFKKDIAAKLGETARNAFKTWAGSPAELAAALGWSADAPLTAEIHERIGARLQKEPVEDFRIDFEDGYGNRPSGEEDAHARGVGAALHAGMRAKSLPAFIGLRIKPLNEELRDRSLRTLTLVLATLLKESKGKLPQNFVVTLPKITVVEQVEFFTSELGKLERKFKLKKGALKFEIMVETPQNIIGLDGRCPLPAMIAAGEGRITGAHFGTYDYTAGVGITADHQHMRHPACDFAKAVMQVALAGTGVWLSDGSTTLLPVAPIRAGKKPLSAEDNAENRRRVHEAWRKHYDDVTHSLAGGFYQGWDLHPAQLVTRYAALFHFFLAGMSAASARLKNFVEKAAQATLVGDVFDDAATGQGLLNYFLRAINCGATTEEKVLAETGLSVEELRTRSFVAILKARAVAHD